MDRDNRGVSVSPYLLRPLRSIVQAMRDMARPQKSTDVKVPEPQVVQFKTPSEAE